MSRSPITFGTADLTNCDREQIHVPGLIQPHGALLAMEAPSLTIVHAGGDLMLVTGEPGVLGRRLDEMLGPAQCAQVRAAAEDSGKLERPHHLFSHAVGDRMVDASLHASGNLLVLELEPRYEAEPDDPLSLVQNMVGQVRRTATSGEAFVALAHAVREVSGFDRVMVYRFLDDGTGTVEAEARSDEVQSYMGLRYPASDIPRQARELYLRNGIRIIPDSKYHACPRAAAFADTASGMMALSVSRSPRDYVIWFKPEVIQTVNWAGDPRKPMDDERISPRKSFQAWQQTVEFHSEPWSPLDRRTAESLRVSLLEIVLQHTDQLAREREQARIQQQALMEQLDARIAQWERTAAELKRESDRRAVVEAELSQVLRRTVLDQEAERQSIARELHDSLGQYLTVMQLDLDGIGRDSDASASIRRRVDKLKSLTMDVGQEVNQMAWDIRPTALDDLGLQKAFQQFLEEWAERSSLKFDVHLTLDDRRLPPVIESTLYRVLQEAIRNVVKHAQAARIGVILEATTRQVRLIVEDDGKGFVWEAPDGAIQASDRLGLLGIRERLA